MIKYIDILTLFPELFEIFLRTSIVGRAVDNHLVNINLRNFRNFSSDNYGKVDDYPYGGGPGVLLKIEPIYKCLNYCINQSYSNHNSLEIIMLSPKGQIFNNRTAQSLFRKEHLIFLCGRYEGFDERIRKHLITKEISIGDFITAGGETPAMVILESIIRLKKNVIRRESVEDESGTNNLLEYPQYTRPKNFNGWSVPNVLLSGHHKQINTWRTKERLKLTKEKRPDLFDRYIKRKRSNCSD